jgi:hypothetical protein
MWKENSLACLSRLYSSEKERGTHRRGIKKNLYGSNFKLVVGIRIEKNEENVKVKKS